MRAREPRIRTFSRYRVAGDREYRDHAPGEEFTASLDPRVELRAIRRGDLEVLERNVEMGLRPGMLVLPSGWVAEIPQERIERAAERRLTTLERSGAYGLH